MEVGLNHRRHLELMLEPFALEGLVGEADVLHGHRHLHGEELEQTHVVGGKGFGTGPRFFVGGDQDAEGARIRLQW